MQYLDAISKMTEWSLFISKANLNLHWMANMILARNCLVARARNLRLAHGKKGVVVHLYYAITQSQESESGQASWEWKKMLRLKYLCFLFNSLSTTATSLPSLLFLVSALQRCWLLVKGSKGPNSHDFTDLIHHPLLADCRFSREGIWLNFDLIWWLMLGRVYILGPQHCGAGGKHYKNKHLVLFVQGCFERVTHRFPKLPL